MAAKRSVLLVVALLAASFAGGAASHWLLVVRADRPEAPNAGPQPITTTNLVLVDETGNKRAELKCEDEDGSPAALVMYYDNEETSEHAEIALGASLNGYGLSVKQYNYAPQEEAARVAAGDTSLRLGNMNTTVHIGIDDFLPAVQMGSCKAVPNPSIDEMMTPYGTARLNLGLDAGGDYGLTISNAEDQQLVSLGTSEGDPELRLHDPDSDKTIHASVNRAQALLHFSEPGDAGAYLLLDDHATFLGLFGDRRSGGYRRSLKLCSGPSFGGPAISLDGGDSRHSTLALDGLLVTSDMDMARLGIDQFGALIKLTDNGKTVWSESAGEARRRTHEQFLRHRITFVAQDNSLEDIFLYIAEVWDLTIQPEWPALKASGVTPDTAVNVDLKSALLKDVLRAVLDDVAGDEPLGYFIDDDGVIVITTQSNIEQ